MYMKYIHVQVFFGDENLEWCVESNLETNQLLAKANTSLDFLCSLHAYTLQYGRDSPPNGYMLHAGNDNQISSKTLFKSVKY